MLSVIASIVVLGFGVSLVWRSARPRTKLAGAALVGAGLTLVLWRHPAREQVRTAQRDTEALKTDVCREFEHQLRRVAAQQETAPFRPLTALPPPSDVEAARIVRYQGELTMLSSFLTYGATLCLPDSRDCDSWASAMIAGPPSDAPAVKALLEAFHTGSPCRRYAPPDAVTGGHPR